MSALPMIDPVLLSYATDGSEINLVERAEKDKGGIDPFKTKRTFLVRNSYNQTRLLNFINEIGGMGFVESVSILSFSDTDIYIYLYKGERECIIWCSLS